MSCSPLRVGLIGTDGDPDATRDLARGRKRRRPLAAYDSISSNLGLNTRLRWTIVPGTDRYVVWNHSWEHPIGEDERWSSLQPVEDQAIVKLRYTWRS